MTEEIRNMLDEEIKTKISILSTLPPNGEEYEDVVGNLERLCRLKNEDERILNDRVRIENERIRSEQNKEENIDRKIKLGLAVAELILPLSLYAVWLKRGFEFEKEGTYTSTTFKNLFGGLRPKIG